MLTRLTSVVLGTAVVFVCLIFGYYLVSIDNLNQPAPQKRVAQWGR